MAVRTRWYFSSFDDLMDKWNERYFDVDDIADFDNPIHLDWCARLEDWPPKVAVLFNRNCSQVTLDRLSQSEIPEIRRLVCYHKNVSPETLGRLLEDHDFTVRETGRQYLEKFEKEFKKSRSTVKK